MDGEACEVLVRSSIKKKREEEVEKQEQEPTVNVVANANRKVNPQLNFTGFAGSQRHRCGV